MRADVGKSYTSPTAPPSFREKLDQKPKQGFSLFPLAEEGQVRKNGRSAASLGSCEPAQVCDATPTAASTAQKVQSLWQRPAQAPPHAVYLLRIDPLERTGTVKHFCMLM